jgi:phytoene synthase
MPKAYEAGSSFRPAFYFLDKDQRAALSAYYGYARAVDDIADDPLLPAAEKNLRLQAWRAAVERIFAGTPGAEPLEAELAGAVRTFPLEPGHFLLVLEGVTLDTVKTRYESFEELKGYMFRVASAVGLACLAVFRYKAPGAERLAEKLGYAVQLTNIIRDAAEDRCAGRVYIPAEDLRRFGCPEADLGGSNYTPNFIELMKFEAGRAGALYAEAAALASPSGREQLKGALAMMGLYRELLAKLERGGFRIKNGRVRLNALEKANALFNAWKDYRRLQ